MYPARPTAQSIEALVSFTGSYTATCLLFRVLRSHRGGKSHCLTNVTALSDRLPTLTNIKAVLDYRPEMASPAVPPPPSSLSPSSPITCHVLNTVNGQPGSSIFVSLTLLDSAGPSAPLTSTTDANGRVTSWDATEGGGPGLDELFANATTALLNQEEIADAAQPSLTWALKFDVGAYFKGEGWWDQVEIRFKTDIGGKEDRKHWHVPLLLSPYSYTTYRGS